MGCKTRLVLLDRLFIPLIAADGVEINPLRFVNVENDDKNRGENAWNRQSQINEIQILNRGTRIFGEEHCCKIADKITRRGKEALIARRGRTEIY